MPNKDYDAFVFFTALLFMNNSIIQQFPLITPEELSGSLGIAMETKHFLHHSRETVNKIIHGEGNQLLVVVGPCSIHDPNAAIEYAKKLKVLSKRFSDALFLVMRVYFEKPRTSLGWKGLIYDPHLNNTSDITTGLKTARQLLLELNSMGVPVATEFVDTLIPQYIQDLVTWGAIGARTSESQIHRQLASSLPLPLGFKNSMSGDVHVAVNAVRAANKPQTFLNINSQGLVTANISTGNNNCHIILRGGRNHTNFDAAHINESRELLYQHQLNPYIMVDCSHGNSHGDPTKQSLVLDALCEQLQNPTTPPLGVMIESNLKSGKQDFKPGEEHTYGVSITDGCISWEETQILVEKLANSVKSRTRATADAKC